MARVWADLVASGWREAILRYASHLLILGLLFGAFWVRGLDLGPLEQLAAKAQIDITAPAPLAASTEAGSQAAPTADVADTPPVRLALDVAAPLPSGMLSRQIDLHTLIPTRGRSTVITYTVQRGDTLFGIAEKYSLSPETLLWGNYFTLKDDPHLLFPGQVLNILPTNGTYHYVTEGNTLEQIAKFYGVAPEAIVDWSGNGLDPTQLALPANTWLVIPGGRRELQSWVVPTINRTTKTTRANNFGQCPGGYSGAIGDGIFGWPADSRTLSGYDYTSIHHGLDFRAGLGAPIYAVDHGVVVYAGPNDYGYGNLIVIDHGNGWQSVYAHLSQWNVACGQSLFRGNLIGLAGSTGRSSGPHLHFELRYNGGYVNPWSVLGP